jgi:hypothetical protein
VLSPPSEKKRTKGEKKERDRDDKEKKFARLLGLDMTPVVCSPEFSQITSAKASKGCIYWAY